MTGRTHAIVGANAAWLTVALGMVDKYSALFVAVGAFVALLPDIDASDAKIHHIGKGILGGFRCVARHRTIFHSLLIVIIIFIVSFIFLQKFHPLLPWIITSAYLSHLILDALTKYGIELFYPFKRRFRLLPKKYSLKIKGLFDRSLFILGALTLVIYFMIVSTIF